MTKNPNTPACDQNAFLILCAYNPALNIDITSTPSSSNPDTRRQIIFRTSVNVDFKVVQPEGPSLCMAVGSGIWVWVLEREGRIIVGRAFCVIGAATIFEWVLVVWFPL